MAEITNNLIVLKNYVTGAPQETDMEFRESKISLKVPAGSGGVLLKNLYLSCDPYMRGRMRDFHGSYIPPFERGSVIEGFGVSKVLDSDNPKFAVGELVSGMTGWEEYSLVRESEKLRKIEISDVPLSYHLGLLGKELFLLCFITAFCCCDYRRSLVKKA